MEPIILNPNNDASSCMQTSASTTTNAVSQLKKLFLKTNISIANTNNTNNTQQLQINSESITLKPRQTYTNNRNINEIQNVRPMSPTNLKISKSVQQAPMLNLDSYSSDEFESAFKIKENIQMSLKNLKPTLAGLDVLRSSASDDDDWSQPQAQQQDSQQAKPVDNNNNHTEAKKALNPTCFNSNNVRTHTKPLMTLVTGNTNAPPSTVKLQTTSTLTKPNYVRAPNRSTYYLPTTTSIAPTILTPIYNSATACLKRQTVSKISNKRGKEEALSNSSSSDEDDHQQQSQKANQNKLQQLLLNNTPMPNTSQLSTLKLPITTNSMNFNNNLRQQNYNITPVTSSAQTHAYLQQQQQLQPHTIPTIITTIASNPKQAVDNDGVQHAKVCQESENKQSLSLSSQSSPILSSSASSIASYSPIHSVTSPSATNETFDLLDDSSSTASGPIYVRQPGFEHHAHEVTLEQTKTPNTTNNNPNQSDETKITKIASESNKIKNLLTTASGGTTSNIALSSKSNNKAKKKLCTITNTTCTLPPTIPNHVNNTLTAENTQNTQLIPLAKHQKKGMKEQD
jgi:hypothetical protein